MYQAAILLDYHGSSVDVELQLPPSRLARVLGTAVTAQTLPGLQQAMATYVASRLYMSAADGALWVMEQKGRAQWQVVDGAPYVVLYFVARPPRDQSVHSFQLHSDVLTDRWPGQVVLLSVRSDWNSSIFASDPQLIGILDSTNRDVEIDRGQGSWARGFGSIFHLGVRHIAEGTDHLLFLLALLLPAPLIYRAGRWQGFAGVRQGLLRILQVVTAFTVGHSITLALAASGLAHVPEPPVEVLIAVSILLSAAHAIRPLFPGKEALVAGSFGLIHGLAFASTLAELGLRGWERTASIFAFNAGIECMQLVVVLCVMPSLMLLSQTPAYSPFRIAGAAFAGVAACGWIAQRSFAIHLPIDPMVDALARHGILLAVLLLAGACGTYVVTYARRS